MYQNIIYKLNLFSFRFPKNDILKQKWMNIIGISKVTKNTLVCSDHFVPESYHQTDGYTILKRLLSTAVPVINAKLKVLSDVTNESITLDKKNYIINNENSNSRERTQIIGRNAESSKIENTQFKNVVKEKKLLQR